MKLKSTTRVFAALAALGAIVLPACSQAEPTLSDHEAMTRDLYETVITMDTSVTEHRTGEMVTYLAGHFRDAGFAPEDIIEVPITDEQTSLIVRYPGSDKKAKGVGFLAHMDVVTAFRKDWELDPFTLTERDGYFIGRGTMDNKLGVIGLTATFLKLKRAGYVPNRTMVLIFTSDEETGMTAAEHIANTMGEVTNIEFAINSDALSGVLTPDGKLHAYYVQSAEKTYHSVTLTVTNPGGHSSQPRPDNAIYQLSHALTKIQAHRFPTRINDVSRGMLEFAAKRARPELAQAIATLLGDPSDEAAAAIVSADPLSGTVIHTTCVATLLEAGHADNALPQSASASVNCRIMPGVDPADVEAELIRVVNDPGVIIAAKTESHSSPASPMRADVLDAITYAIADTHPEADLVPFMASYGTDGTAFRAVGTPVYGSSGTFMNPAEIFAHGLNEKAPVSSLYDSLGYWERLMKVLTGGAGD